MKYSTTRSCVASATLDVESLVSSPTETRVKSLLQAGGGPMRPEDLELAGTPPPTASDAKKVLQPFQVSIAISTCIQLGPFFLLSKHHFCY